MRFNGILAVAPFLIAAADCRGGEATKPGEAVLAGPGFIKCSGGCELYTEARLDFTPDGNRVRVTVDNSRYWFYWVNGAMPSFTTTLSGEEAAEFFSGLERILNSPRPGGSFTTRAAVVEIYLPLRGRVVAATWREEDTSRDINPLVDYIRDFVEKVYVNR